MKNKTENDFLAIFTSFLELQNYVFSSKAMLCKVLLISEKDTNSWDFFRVNVKIWGVNLKISIFAFKFI